METQQEVKIQEAVRLRNLHIILPKGIKLWEGK